MTTFLLHGGKTSKQNFQNEHFFQLFTELANKDKVVVLLCYFAREKEKWESLIERDTNYIKKATTKHVEILIAHSPRDLLQKIDAVDVLYVAGGEAELIEPLYKELTGLSQKLDGKVYAGSSMGAFLASKQYVLSSDSQNSKEVHKGLDLLPIQVLCHWDVETEKERKLNLLKKKF